MHTVITADCTGCELCLPPCPVDCITLAPTGAPRNHAAQKSMAARARELHTARTRRLDSRNRARRNPAVETVIADAGRHKRETIARALARAQARLAGKSR
jgi:electron transport complex protein RnfB